MIPAAQSQRFHPFPSVLGLILTACGPAALVRSAEIEPNDSILTATPAPFSLIFDGVVWGQEVGSGDHGALDVDLFRIDVPPDWPFPISLSALAASDPSVDLMLRLFDSNGIELLRNDDGNEFQPHLPAFYTLLLSPGSYYLGVSSSENPHYDPNVPASGRVGAGGTFDLFLSGAAVPFDPSPREPNDSSGTATWLGYGSFDVPGEFIGDGAHGRVDVDVYRVTLFTPARLDIAADSADGIFDPVVRVRSCDDPLPTPTWDDRCSLGGADDGPDGSIDALLSTASFEPGDVYIMVSGAGNRAFDPATPGSGEPGSVGQYDLSVVVSPLGSLAADEPNDSISTATPTPLLIEGRPDSFGLDGFLGDGPYATHRGDRDFYALRVLGGSRVLSIDAYATLGSDFKPVLVVYDVQGRVHAFAEGSAAGHAHVEAPAGCFLTQLGDVETPIIVLVMGTRQRLPTDPFDPIEDDYGGFRQHRVTDGPGSTGTYRLDVMALPQVSCPVEPGDDFGSASPTGLTDGGFYLCGEGFLGDGLNCSDPLQDLDAWFFDVVRTPVDLRVQIWGCHDSAAASDISAAIVDSAGTALAEVRRRPLDTQNVELTASIFSAGRYWVVVSSCAGSLGELLGDPCSDDCPGSGSGFYDLAITLSPGHQLAAETVSSPSSGTASELLFATRLDDLANAIVSLDPATGAALASFPAPEPRFGGTGGLATNGKDLFFVGGGRFPVLYRMDPSSGNVLEEFFSWFGSGYCSDAAMLGDELYLLDYRHRQVHVINPFEPSLVRSLNLGSMHDITIGGGLAALANPNRLYVADAFNTKSVYEVYPFNGALTSTVEPGANRPAALAGLGSGNLVVGDFRTSSLEILDRAGSILSKLAVAVPVGSLAGAGSDPEFGDLDADGDVDLRDLLAFQNCFHGDAQDDDCVHADFNGDGLIDLSDAGNLLAATSGP